MTVEWLIDCTLKKQKWFSVRCLLGHRTLSMLPNLRSTVLPACCAIVCLGQSPEHSGAQLSPWGGQRWGGGNCKLWRQKKDTNRFLSWFANFQVLIFHSQWFLFFLKQQFVGEVWSGEARLLDFYWGRFLLVGDGSWRNYTLMWDSHRSGQTTRWPCHSLYSIPLFLLLEVRDPLWSL